MGRLFPPMPRQCRHGVTGHFAALSRRRLRVRVPVSVRCRAIGRRTALWEWPNNPVGTVGAHDSTSSTVGIQAAGHARTAGR